MVTQQRRRMVVTGCSSGFGLVIAKEAIRRGWLVFGTVRRVEDGEALRQAGGKVGLLDLTDSSSCKQCALEIIAWCEGALDCVIHNAGTAFPAPMVGADRDDLRQQFEINTIGQIDFNGQLIEPLLAAGNGCYLFDFVTNADRLTRAVCRKTGA